MDLTRPVSFRSVALNTIIETDGVVSGCAIESCDYSAVDVRQFTEPNARADGIDVGGVWIGARHIQVSGTIYGVTRAAAAAAYDTLDAIMLPESGTLGVYSFTFYSLGAGGPVLREFFARPNGLRTVFDRRMLGGDDSSPLAIPWTVAMVVYGGNGVVPAFVCGITDTFSRIVPTTLGTSDSGLTWEEDIGASAGGVFSVNGTFGFIGHTSDVTAGQRLQGLPAGHWAGLGGKTTKFRVKFSNVSTISDGTLRYSFGLRFAAGTHRPSVLFRVSTYASWGWIQAQDVSSVVGNKQIAYGVAKTDWVADTWYNVKWFYEAGGRQKLKIWTDAEGEPGWAVDVPTTYTFTGDPTGFFVSVDRANGEQTLFLTATIDDLDIEGINMCTP